MKIAMIVGVALGLTEQEEYEKKSQEMMMQGEQLVHQHVQKMALWVAADPQIRGPTARSPISAGGPTWKNNLVKWCHDPNINARSLDSFRVAIKQYESAMPGCIRFEELRERNGNCLGYPSISAVYVQSSSGGCFVNGLIGEWPELQRNRWGRHSINLAPNGCDTVGVSVHELGHVLGMAHEQKRRDRDQYIRVNWNNIKSDWRSQFTAGDAYVAGKYDYESMMHYPMYSGQVALNAAQPLMTPVNCGTNCPNELGQRVGLSKLDQEQMVAMYQCKAENTAVWTSQTVCIDSPSQKGNCAAYVRQGGCRRDGTPCCACKRWNSGWKVRKYGSPISTKPTTRPTRPKPTTKPKIKPVVPRPTRKVCRKKKDRLSRPICTLLKSNNLCWTQQAKLRCWASCGVCTNADLKDGANVRQTKRRGDRISIKGNQAQVYTKRSRKLYIGGFSRNYKYEGAGLLLNGIHKGDQYYGSFKNGEFHGNGTYKYKNGDQYTGDFVTNSFEGNGTFNQTSKGETYTGQWKNDQKSGSGTWKNNWGESYVGDFLDNMSDGYGVWKSADGDEYRGYWEGDLFQGQGTYTYSDGYQESGEWDEGYLN